MGILLNCFTGRYWNGDSGQLAGNRRNYLMIAAIISSAIFIITLYLIFSERLNRTIAALAGAVLMIILGLLFGFYTEADGISYIDFNTLGLLFGMMVIVAVLEPTGFFQYLAIRIGKRSKGNPFCYLFFLAP
jgi:Na+/H+ antiporter NhaD/arsenite permease-like protein